MKKILFVINTMGRAGAERALISLLKTLEGEKYEIDFISIVDLGDLFPEIPDYVNILNKNPSYESVFGKEGEKHIKRLILRALFKKGYIIKYIPYFFKNIFAQLKRGKLLFDKLFWLLLAKAAPRSNKQYDLVVGYTEGAATYYTSMYSDTAKRAAFVHVDYEKAGYIKSLDEKYYKNIDKIFCVSDTVRDNFIKTYPEYAEKTFVFHNIILPDEIISRAQNGSGFDDGFEGLRILTVARLQPQKAFDISIAAFELLIKQGYNIRWYVFGEGPERSMLEKLIKEKGLTDKFLLPGMTDNPYPYFDQCDIYVQASLFEGRSISVEEALILCKPVIISDVAGADEQIENGKTGFIIKPTKENIAEAIRKLIDSAALREEISNSLKAKQNEYNKDVKYLYELLGTERENVSENIKRK